MFGFTRTGIKQMIYRNRGEQANHNTTNENHTAAIPLD
jgi:hypothetical protein